MAVLSQSVAVKAGSANLAVETVGVVQTLKAPAVVRVAVARSAQISVVATLAGLAATARHLGISKIIFGTVFAPGPGITLETLANHVLRYRI